MRFGSSVGRQNSAAAGGNTSFAWQLTALGRNPHKSGRERVGIQ